MGCFPVFMNLRKRYVKCKSENSRLNEHVSTTMPQSQASRLLNSDSPILRTSMNSNNSINRVTNDRTRGLSAPSALDAAEKEALASIENEEQEMSDVIARIMGEPHSPIPHPLPLPPPLGCSSLASRIARSPLYSSGPALDAAEQDESEEEELSNVIARIMKEPHSPIPQPLPLPSPPGSSPLVSRIARSPLYSSGPALDAAEQEESEEPELSDVIARVMKEPHSPIPQPLPLPSPLGRSPLVSRIARSPLYSSGPALDAAEQDGFESFQYEEKEWYKNQDTSMKGRTPAMPVPLPLPPLQEISPMKAASSSKSGKAIDSVLSLQYEEIAAACHNFSIYRCMSTCLSSTIYKASFRDGAPSKKLKATVTCLHQPTQGLREFMNEVNTLVNLKHPNLCKLLGFYASDSCKPRMLVYERLSNGSLDRLLFGRSDGPSIDWNTRIKIAICAAQALTFLHEEGPLQAMYNDFSAMNIQVDMDFTAKLSGYGFVGSVAERELSRSSHAAANLSMETLEKGLLTPKSNVWSFGIVLLELLTGRKNFDRQFPKKERNLAKWCRPYLADDFHLPTIMDSQLKGQFSLKEARTLANIVQRCLQREPSERPTMRTILETLKTIPDMKYPRLFSLQEPAAIYGRHMSRSPSVNGIINAPRLSFSPLPPSALRTSMSQPPRLSGVPTMLPSPLRCSSAVYTEELTRQESTQSQPPRWSGVPTMLPSPRRCSSAVSTLELTRQGSTQSPSSANKKA